MAEFLLYINIIVMQVDTLLLLSIAVFEVETTKVLNYPYWTWEMRVLGISQTKLSAL